MNSRTSSGSPGGAAGGAGGRKSRGPPGDGSPLRLVAKQCKRTRKAAVGNVVERQRLETWWKGSDCAGLEEASGSRASKRQHARAMREAQGWLNTSAG
eukprot:90061-Chlamydomonas_euryale.AAC.1